MPLLLETCSETPLLSGPPSMSSFELDKPHSAAVKSGSTTKNQTNLLSAATSLDIDLDLAVFDTFGEHEPLFPLNFSFNAQASSSKQAFTEVNKPSLLTQQNATMSDKNSSSSDSLKIPLPKELLLQHSHSFNELSLDFDNHFHFSTFGNDFSPFFSFTGTNTETGTMPHQSQSFTEDLSHPLTHRPLVPHHQHSSQFNFINQSQFPQHQQQQQQTSTFVQATNLQQQQQPHKAKPLKLNRNLKRKTKSLDQLPNFKPKNKDNNNSTFLPPTSPLQSVNELRPVKTSPSYNVNAEKENTVIENFESILSSFKAQPQTSPFQTFNVNESFTGLTSQQGQQMKTEQTVEVLYRQNNLRQDSNEMEEADPAFSPPLFKKQKSLPTDFTVDSLASSKHSSDTERLSNHSFPRSQIRQLVTTPRRDSNSSDSSHSLSHHSKVSKSAKPKRSIKALKSSVLGLKEKQRRVKWSDDDIRTIWTSIAAHGNEWRVVQHDLPKRSYHQVKDKGRRLLRTECWQTGKCKKASDVACEVAKEIAKQVLNRLGTNNDNSGSNNNNNNSGFQFGDKFEEEGEGRDEEEEGEELESEVIENEELEEVGENVKFEDLLPFDLNEDQKS